MGKTVRIYEDYEGGIQAVIYQNGKVKNLLFGLENCICCGSEFIEMAKTGFEFADQYDDSENGGVSIDAAVDALDSINEEIAMISPEEVILYQEYMKPAGRRLFAIEERRT